MDISLFGGDGLADDGLGAHGPTGDAAADSAAADGSDGMPAAVGGDHLWMHDDGRVWDLGPADVDTDDDGVKDSLTRSGPDGLVVYTDSDHDGQVDKITHVARDGSYSATALDPESGRWVATDTGRLG